MAELRFQLEERFIIEKKDVNESKKKAKEAITEWTVVKNFKNYTLVKVRIVTGRTHQIRVHFSAIGHPILGDRIYGKKTTYRVGQEKITYIEANASCLENRI